MIRQLKFDDHEYSAFFVCRNPIEKMLSVYDHFKWHLNKNKDSGSLKKDAKYYTWPEFVNVVARLKG